MGLVTVEILIENLEDVWAARQGVLLNEHVRRVMVPDALVDTSVPFLSLPTRLIRALGLTRTETTCGMSNARPSEAVMYEAARLTIQGRSCTMDVLESSDTLPAVIGRLPLLHLDWVADLQNRALVGNPAHGGEHVYEMY